MPVPNHSELTEVFTISEMNRRPVTQNHEDRRERRGEKEIFPDIGSEQLNNEPTNIFGDVFWRKVLLNGKTDQRKERNYIRHRAPNINKQGTAENDLIGLVTGLPLPLNRHY